MATLSTRADTFAMLICMNYVVDREEILLARTRFSAVCISLVDDPDRTVSIIWWTSLSLEVRITVKKS